MRKYSSEKERIEKNIKVDNNGCWIWQKYTSKDGYGRLGAGSRSDNTKTLILAHRYSYLVYVGEIPKGMCVCHKCDNPPCVNPEHLFIGTVKDNMHDRDKKKRGGDRSGENNGRSKLTPDIVLLIRKSDETSRRLGKIFGVSKTTILAIKNGKLWKCLSSETQRFR